MTSKRIIHLVGLLAVAALAACSPAPLGPSQSCVFGEAVACTYQPPVDTLLGEIIELSSGR